MLRVLASEASIAIENARLFHEERTKARHLSLLNTISRNAIATLNPDEMLAKIAEQLEAGPDLRPHRHRRARIFDARNCHPGRSGTRRGALGQRIPLGTGLHRPRRAHGPDGRLPPHFAQANPRMKPLLPDSVAAIGFARFLRGTAARRALRGILGSRRILRGGDACCSRTLGRSDFRRTAQCVHVPEGAGAGHHRRPHRRQDASLLHGSSLRGMEALHARRPGFRPGADGPGPLQVRQRFLRPSGGRSGSAARRPHS